MGFKKYKSQHRVQVGFPEPHFELITILSDRLEVSKSEVVRRAVHDYLLNFKKECFSDETRKEAEQLLEGVVRYGKNRK